MQNLTLVVLTDSNDLKDQFFGQFQCFTDILGQTPVQANRREHLRELLNRASGGVVFTTIHKFMPPSLGSSRREEAHSQPEGGQSLVTSAATEFASLRYLRGSPSFMVLAVLRCSALRSKFA